MLKFIFKDIFETFERITKNDIIALISFIVLVTILLIANFKTIGDDPVIVIMIFSAIGGVAGYVLSFIETFKDSIDHKRVLFYIVGVIIICVLSYTAI